MYLVIQVLKHEIIGRHYAAIQENLIGNMRLFEQHPNKTYAFIDIDFHVYIVNLVVEAYVRWKCKRWSLSLDC